MAQHEYPHDDSAALQLVEVGDVDTDTWLETLAVEVEPTKLPGPVAVYLHEARAAGEV